MDSTLDIATEQPAGKAMIDSFTDSMGKARGQMSALAESMQPQLDELVIYIKDEPAKAVLMAAGAGALVAALLLSTRTRRGMLPSASRIGSGLSGLVDSARDMLDQAGSMAADGVSDARKRFAGEADERIAKGAKQARAARDAAADAAGKAADKAADKAGDGWSDGMQSLRDARDSAIGAARQTAERAYDDLTRTLQDLRGKAAPLLDRVQPPIESVADYTKSSPFKALLIAAVAAALLSRVVG